MKIKFCGITNLEDAKNAIGLGVDYLGFIIDFPQSPRSITLEQFKAISAKIKNYNSKTLSAGNRIPKIAAVTINMPEEKLNRLINTGLVDVIQFHGDETPEFCGRFRNKAEVWRSFKINPGENSESALSIVEKFKGKIDRFLLDASSAEDKAEGASNKFSNFGLFKKLEQADLPLILAGGINPDNVKYYLDKLKPEIIDAASGVEERPGKKSREKMKKLMKIINGAE